MRLATLAICLVALFLTACDCGSCGDDCAPPAGEAPIDGGAATELQSDQPMPGEAGGHPSQVGSGGGLGG